jgi:nickel-type superoxide dismutase maturation protease
MTTLPDANWRDLLLWLLRRRRRVRVTNRSMLPLLKPDDELLIDPRAYRQRPPQPDDIVIAWHPTTPQLKIIKRVDRVLADGRVYVVGVNSAESSDSRHFGPLAPHQLIGRATCRF